MGWHVGAESRAIRVSGDPPKEKTYTPPRVVSLISSATEIVCALGLERALVGRSHECDYPPSVQRLPQCTRPRFNVEGTSKEIDERVKQALHEGPSVYHVDAALLRELRPDVVITQAQCEVCAVSPRDVENAVCSWGSGRPRIVTLLPNCLADVWTDIQNVADALEFAERGRQLIASLRSRMDEIARQAANIDKPRIACIEWIDPLMAAGNWTPELIQLAGGVELFGKAGAHSGWLKWEELQEQNPDMLLAAPCGFGLRRTLDELPTLTHHSNWRELTAVRTGRVYAADGNQFFNRPGPRLVESLEILAEILHPQLFRFGHEGTGWQRFDGR
jgi:iron complex transport system substrate-binding protein